MFYVQKHLRLLLSRRTKPLLMNCHNHSTVKVGTAFTKVKDLDTGNVREIGYKKYEGSKENQIIYIPGFLSGMCGIKATSLEVYCQKNNFTYTRYDPTGIGESNSIPMHQARLTHWMQDAETILNLSPDPQIVVASSLGGWVAARLCLKCPEKFRALVLLAPGINFTSRFFDQVSGALPKSAMERLKKGETLSFNHPDFGKFPISLELSDDLYKNEIDFSQGLNIECPVRIIHGTLDPDVPYEESMNLIHRIKSSDVQLTYIKDGQHRLSTTENLELIFSVISRLISKKSES